MRVEQKVEPKKPEKFIPPQPITKVVIIMVLAVLSSALFWLAWHNAIVTGLELSLSAQNILIVVSTLLAFSLMFTFLALAEVLISNTTYELVMTILSAGTLFLFFKPTLWTFIAWLLVVLGILYWRREVRLDESTRTKFIPHKIIGAGLKVAVSFILLAVSFTYYSFVVSDNSANEEITERLARSGSNGVQSVLSFYYGDGFDPEMELDNFITNIAFTSEELLDIETGNEELDSVISEGLTTAQDDIVGKARVDFLKTFDIEARGDDTMDFVINMIVSRNLNKYAGDYLKFIPALMALGLFFVLNFFSFIYRELIKSFGYIIFHILLWIKFLEVKKIQIEAEKISLNDGK